jgi:phenylacetaldehyde dehydrogenase
MSALPFDGHAIAPETEAFLKQKHRLLIANEWVDGSGEMVSKDPATGLELARFAIGGAAEIDRAVAAARAAFEGPWGRLTVAERTALMFRLARIMEANATLLTQLDILDNGMPGFIAGLTTANCVEMVDYYAGAIMRIEGTTIAPPPYRRRNRGADLYAAGTCRRGRADRAVECAALHRDPEAGARAGGGLHGGDEVLGGNAAFGAGLGADDRRCRFPGGVVNIVNGLGRMPGRRWRRTPMSTRSASPARPPRARRSWWRPPAI